MPEIAALNDESSSATLIPEAAHVCGSYPTQILFCGTSRVLEHRKVEDPGENHGG